MSKKDFVGKVFSGVLCGLIGFSSVGSIEANPKDDINANQQAIIATSEDKNLSNSAKDKEINPEKKEVKKDHSEVKPESKKINSESKGAVQSEDTQSQKFYRTKTGKCYHESKCSHLKNSKIEVTDKEVKEQNLKPCSRCCKSERIKSENSQINKVEPTEDEKQSEQFYRTKTGKCYHRENCSCLKKSKIKVSQEEIKEADLKSCKRCCK